MNATAGVVVGIDLGGTRLRVGAAPAEIGVPVAGNVINLTAVPAPDSLDEFVAAVDAALVAAVDVRSLTGLAVAVPGLVDGTTCRWVPNLPYLDGVDLAGVVAGAAHLAGRGEDRVAVGNDAHLALLAEASEGAAAGRDDALLLAIGTGIGSAVLSGGQIQRGSSGAACSFGWACADVHDSGDERHGWLERHAAGPVLDAVGSAMTPAVDGAGVVAAGRRGHAEARAALDGAATALGTALAGAVALLDPGLVIVSGGLAEAVDMLAPAVRSTLTRQLPRHLQKVEIVSGRFGSGAGLAGALLAARRQPHWWEVAR